jgi:periplasmic protein TonB
MRDSVEKTSVAVLLVLLAGSRLEARSQEPSSAPQEQAKQPAPQRVRVSQGLAEQLLVKRVNPECPKDLRKQRIQGMVLLAVRINKDGEVVEANLISGHPGLAQAAIDAVKQWKYKPYLLDGQPVQVETRVQVNFSLAGG